MSKVNALSGVIELDYDFANLGNNGMVATPGVPQGIEVVATGSSTSPRSRQRESLHLDRRYSTTGALVRTMALPTVIDESHGLADDPADNTVYLGSRRRRPLNASPYQRPRHDVLGRAVGPMDVGDHNELFQRAHDAITAARWLADRQGNRGE